MKKMIHFPLEYEYIKHDKPIVMQGKIKIYAILCFV